jgi:hypothetical protein
MRIAIGIILLFLMASCVPKDSQRRDSEFQPGERLSEIKEKKLGEVSGLASSVTNPGKFWAHNDRGNRPEVYLIDDKCEIKMTVVLDGIKNRDWEDIAVGPGPDSAKSYVYVGDIGDNDGVYQLKFIYRFEEPLNNPDEDKVTITDFETIAFRLPDSRKMDSEALFIDAATSDLYVVTKREKPVHVYQIKYSSSVIDTVTAREVGALPLYEIVAADLSADGKDLIMKNYSHIYYWANSEGKSIPELLKQNPVEIPYHPEPQGESLAWARDNSGFYTLSEIAKGQKSYLYFYARK